MTTASKTIIGLLVPLHSDFDRLKSILAKIRIKPLTLESQAFENSFPFRPTGQNHCAEVLVAVGLVVAAGFAIKHSGSTAYGAVSAVTHLEQGVWWFSNTHYFGTSQQTSVSSTGAVSIGTNGSAVAGLNWSNCSLIASSFTVAASTTVAMDCAITGATPGDFVLAGFGTSTIPTGGSWRIIGASASSTSGYDTLQIRNDSGASNVIPAQLASSTRILNLR